MARGRTILEFSAYKIKILRPHPLITGTRGVIKSQSGKVYCWFPSLDDTYQHWISILPINLMFIKVRFLCTCTVMDDAKSLACFKDFLKYDISGQLFLKRLSMTEKSFESVSLLFCFSINYCPWPLTLPFDLDLSWPLIEFCDHRPNVSEDIACKCTIRYVVLAHFLRYEIFSSLDFGPVTDGQKAMHMSPLCMSTGVLNNYVGPEVHWCFSQEIWLQ